MTPTETGRGTASTPFDFLDELYGTQKKAGGKSAYEIAAEKEAMVRDFLWEEGILSVGLSPGTGHPFVFRDNRPVSLGFQSYQLDISIGLYRGEIKTRSVPLFKKPSDFKYKTVFLDDLDGINKKIAPIDFYITLSHETTIEDLRKGHGALVVPVKYSQYHGYLLQERKWIPRDGVYKTNLSCPREHCLDNKNAVESFRELEHRSYEEKKIRDSMLA
jgi:hypothetical protein